MMAPLNNISLIMRHRIMLLCQILMIAVIAIVCMTMDAQAATLAPLSGCEGEGVVARIVPCIANAMEKTTTQLTIAMEAYLAPTFFTVLTLSVILFGVKAMSPEGNIPKVGVPYLIKVGIVTLFMSNFGGFIPAVYGTMNDSVDILSNALVLSEDCPVDIGGAIASASGVGSKIWQQYDCVLGKLFGFSGEDGNVKLIASVFGLLTGFLFGGSFGMIAFLGIMGLLWSVFMLVYRSVLAFLSGYLLACFMIVISPLFIPLALFQATQPYFKKWLDTFIGAFLLPVLIVGYSIFALTIYNKFLFEEDSAEAIRMVMDKAFAESITDHKTVCLGTLLNNAFFRSLGGGSDAFNSDSVANVANPVQSGGQGLCLKLPIIDLKKVEGNFQNNQEFFRRIFTDSMALFILAWVLYAGVSPVQQVARSIAGGVASTLVTPVSGIEKQIQEGLRNAQKGATDAFIGADGKAGAGPEFVRNIPAALREGILGFGRGVGG